MGWLSLSMQPLADLCKQFNSCIKVDTSELWAVHVATVVLKRESETDQEQARACARTYVSTRVGWVRD